MSELAGEVFGSLMGLCRTLPLSLGTDLLISNSPLKEYSLVLN